MKLMLFALCAVAFSIPALANDVLQTDDGALVFTINGHKAADLYDAIYDADTRLGKEEIFPMAAVICTIADDGSRSCEIQLHRN